MNLLTLSEKSERTKRIVERSYFPVSKLKKNEKRWNIVNREDGQILSEVSKRYCLVKNIDIFQPFINEFGYDAIHKFYSYGNRKFYHMEIKTGRKFNFGTEENPDIIEEMVTITNSYNKTKSFVFRLGAFRWVCSNGLYSGVAFENYKKIHVGKIPVQKLVFNALLNYQGNTFENWKKLKDVELTEEKRLEIIENFEAFPVYNKDGEVIHSNRVKNIDIKRLAQHMVKTNRNELDNQSNGWGLYNQINASIQRNLNGKSQLDRRVLANNRMENYLLENV